MSVCTELNSLFHDVLLPHFEEQDENPTAERTKFLSTEAKQRLHRLTNDPNTILSWICDYQVIDEQFRLGHLDLTPTQWSDIIASLSLPPELGVLDPSTCHDLLSAIRGILRLYLPVGAAPTLQPITSVSKLGNSGWTVQDLICRADQASDLRSCSVILFLLLRFYTVQQCLVMVCRLLGRLILKLSNNRQAAGAKAVLLILLFLKFDHLSLTPPFQLELLGFVKQPANPACNLGVLVRDFHACFCVSPESFRNACFGIIMPPSSSSSLPVPSFSQTRENSTAKPTFPSNPRSQSFRGASSRGGRGGRGGRTSSNFAPRSAVKT